MMETLSAKELLLALIQKAVSQETLSRLTFSRPIEKDTIRATARQVRLPQNEHILLHIDIFKKDNKATQMNLDPTDAKELFRFIALYGQINLMTGAGDAEYRCSKSGNCTVIGGEKLMRALSTQTPKRLPIGGNNRQKAYILTGKEPFLKLLGISDQTGRVHDKKQAKFRQINRFLELIRDVEPHLPAEGTLHICDLCCGKSYLSFAVYHYFAVLRGREVRMDGVDLKPDVISYCNQTAESLGWSGMHFAWGDVSRCEVEMPVHMVISLHACDTATDLVLERAMHWKTDVILSTPCCHHVLNHALNCPSLDFIARHSMLRQKFCDAATDALRLQLMEANGYTVSALELIDPEETPKNILLRGIRKKQFDPTGPDAARMLAEYDRLCAFLLGEEQKEQTED